MTRNEFITTTKFAISTYVTDKAIANIILEYLADEESKLVRSRERASEKRADKWYEENGELLEKVENYLKAEGGKTASEIAEQFEISTSKATAVCKRIPNVDIGTLAEGSRVVKTYGVKEG